MINKIINNFNNLNLKYQLICIILFIIITDLLIVFDIIILRPIFTFLTFGILPGFLIIKILRIRQLEAMEDLLLSVGLSVIFLMIAGLFVNEIFYFFGDKTPLNTYSITLTFTAIFLFSCILIYIMNKEKPLFIPPINLNLNNGKILFIPLFIFFLGIWGPIYLNMTENSLISIICLLLILIYSVFIVFKKKSDNTILTISILLISISILLMQSLRSNYLVGSDINTEQFIAQLVINAQYWSLILKNSSLNSCFSVFIVPPIYYFLSGLPLNYVIKIIYPIIYAFTPLSVYLISKKFLEIKYAFLAALIYISQLAFIIGGMYPMRTGLAVFLSSVLFLLIFNKNIRTSKKTFLLIILSMGIVFSHYSTSYIVFLVLFISSVVLFITYSILDKIKVNNVTKVSISVGFALIMFLLIFIWHGQITGSSFTSGLDFITKTIQNLVLFFNNEMAQNDVGQNIVSGSYLAKEIAYKISYISTILTFLLIGLGMLYLFTRKIYSINLPLKIIKIIRIPKIKKHKAILNNNIYLTLSAVLLFILISILIFPFYGYDYQRVLLIALIILAPLYVIGATLICYPFKKHTLKIITLLVVIQFICASGMIFVATNQENVFFINIFSQKTGENFKYINDNEFAASEWIKKYYNPRLVIYGDSRVSSSYFLDVGINTNRNFFKFNQTLKKGYIFLRHYNVFSGKVNDIYGSDQNNDLSQYSNLFIGINKIYDSGSQIYFRD